ncbi:MAG TPA: helix-turn-helix domain-containing protein, partial [Woeseiaceae bacterium]|nr:helix-turn-helix domain-containing protein [Woeseiaceae bacterium]
MTHDEMSREEMSRNERSPEETDEVGQAPPDAPTASPRGPRAGARLKEARQARNISLEEIARELHLDVETLRDLEANRFEAFSAPVFSKGYLRRYAGLVGVP